MELGAANNFDKFKWIVNAIKDKYMPYEEGLQQWDKTTEENSQNLILPPWLCQPYVRMAPDQHIKLVEAKQGESLNEVYIFNFTAYFKILLIILFNTRTWIIKGNFLILKVIQYQGKK